MTGLEWGLLIGFAAIDLIVLIGIIIFAVKGEKSVGVSTQHRPQVIVVQQPRPIVATITPEVLNEPVYVEIPDEEEDEDVCDVEIDFEDEDAVYDGEAVIEGEDELLDAAEPVEMAETGRVVDEDAVVFKSVAPTKTLEEAYRGLTKEQKSFFDNLREYALTKPDAKEYRTKSNIKVKSKSGQIVKLLIRRETVVTSFMIENDMLKTYRKELAKDGTKIAVKATVLPVLDVDTFEAAKGLIDVSYEQIEHERELQAEARKERRRLAREAKKAENA